MTEITMISATWCPSCLTTKKLLKEILEKDNTLELNVVDYDLNINEIVNENIIKILEKEIHYDKYCSSKR